MDEGTPLAGSCSCGRNHYVIYAPANSFQSLQVLFDNQAEHSRALSLRVPIAHLQSTTYAFYPDETHSAIRRVFTPHRAPHTKRQFCGFCGTQLSKWSEQPPEEAEWICVNLGSLKNESVEKLEEAGILLGVASEHGRPVAGEESQQIAAQGQGREYDGNSWFEEVIEGSELGRMRRRRGGESSADGKTQVEWEVVEYDGEEGDGGGTATSKRKLESLDDKGDVDMKSN